MSILSSSLTDEFIRAAASTRRAPGADPAGRDLFRDQLDAARSDRRIDRGDDEGRAGAAEDPGREAAQDADDRRAAAAAGADELDDAAEDRREARQREQQHDEDRTRESDGGSGESLEAGPGLIASLQHVEPAMASGVGEGRTVVGSGPAGGVVSDRGGDAAPASGLPAAPVGDDVGAGRIHDGTGRRSSGSGVHVVTAAAGAVPSTTSTSSAPIGPAEPAAVAADPEAAGSLRGFAAGSAAPEAAGVSGRTPNADDAAAHSRSRPVERADGLVRPEAAPERSAYRAALADRASGRDLAPADRQAMAIDERIARARAEAAARTGGSGGRADDGGGPAAGGAAADASGRSAARRVAGVAGPASSAPGGIAPDADAVGSRSTAGSAPTSGPATSSASTASADAGVPARPGPTAGGGVPAAGAEASAGLARPSTDEAVAQALRGVRMLVGRNGGSMTVRLQPGDLGELRVRMDIRGGRVTAEFDTTTEAARTRLEQGLETLRRGLEERGLQVERLTVRGGDPETVRQPADGGRVGRDADAEARERGGSSNAGDGADGRDGGRDDAAGRESSGRRDEPPLRRPIGERASSPDALRAFASIFREQAS